MSATVLIIEDEEAVAWALRKGCERAGYSATVVATAEAGLKKAATQSPRAIFLDIRLPGMDGLTALTRLKEVAPEAGIIVMTAHGNLGTAVKAVQGGAFDYLAKPFDLAQALEAVHRAVTRSETGPPSAAPAPIDGDEIVGGSPAMQEVFKKIALVAPSQACVLITGESGTGKELVARAIHTHSSRRGKPFLPVHVAALNPNLVESELFGHARGAFTGADRPRPGLLTLADGGTVFLDELADIPLVVQAKLLRVLERQEVLPVGATEPHKVDVRVISATHADLASAVAEGRFRHDLLFRLNVYPIRVPPLRERLDDILPLAEHFLHRFGAQGGWPLPAETIAALRSRNWPGNVRELRNALEHAAIVARGGAIQPAFLPPPMARPGDDVSVSDRLTKAVQDWVHERVGERPRTEPADLYQQMLDVVEPGLIGVVLDRVNGNRLAAARWLGLARATLRKLMKKYRLGDPSEGDDEPGETLRPG